MGNLGTFGDFVAAIRSVGQGGGFSVTVNLLFIAAFVAAGLFVGRWLVRKDLRFALAAAVIAAPAFGGAQASWYVINAGVAYLAFLYAVGAESYRRLTDGTGS